MTNYGISELLMSQLICYVHSLLVLKILNLSVDAKSKQRQSDFKLVELDIPVESCPTQLVNSLYGSAFPVKELNPTQEAIQTSIMQSSPPILHQIKFN